MRTSVNWINAYLSSPASAHEQAETLTAVGFPCESCEQLADGDHAQEIETTSNRGDCLCHIGLAREIAAASGRSLNLPTQSPACANEPASAAISVTNHEPQRCPRYTARVIRGVKVAPSPAWLQERLIAIGQIPRNNVVDCTNFVLFEYGQPSHVFDLKTLVGSAIHVRASKKGETFLPLGEGAKTIVLDDGVLVIADAQRPVALAGVKGGAATAVTDSTTDLVIEAAAFDPVAVRKTSRALRIASDSSYRFEREVHPAEVDEAAQRLVGLILETAGGSLLAGSVSAGVAIAPPLAVTLRLDRLHAIAGYQLESREVMQILTVLGFAPRLSGETISCTIPPRRIDVTREIDLIEEVVRLAGLDRIPQHDVVAIRPVGRQFAVEAVRAAKNCLAGLGFVETVSPTLISERAAGTFLPRDVVALRVADERAMGEPILRPSLVASLLQSLKLNRDRGSQSVQLFEHATTFWLEGMTHHERRTIALVAIDSTSPEALYRHVRGAVESLARELRGAHVHCDVQITPACPVCKTAASGLHPAGTLTIDGATVGVIGLINAAARGALGIDGDVAAAELDWESLAQGYPPVPRAQPLASSPLLDRDLSIVVGDDVTWSQIESTVRAAQLPFFESIHFVGNWRGKQLGAGRRSATLRLFFRAPDRTLRREEVEPQLARLTTVLTQTLKAELRT
ncbi:MAG: phenylalanine--tRNA ligase subunit beta [Phycisphaerales bacterium]|nr:phenylalanine--tRNA ligase subunit beta [Phycisphaerales bacterium]